MKPATPQNAVLTAIKSFNKAANGDSNDKEHDEAVKMRDAARALVASIQVLDANDLATVLAALRLFQETYEGVAGRDIAERWGHFQLEDGKILAPLGTEDINRLCETINCADLITFDASKEELLEDDEDDSGPSDSLEGDEEEV